ncbi:MAG: hypothetical protein AAGA56_09560 [Myxococcota bacterium]
MTKMTWLGFGVVAAFSPGCGANVAVEESPCISDADCGEEEVGCYEGRCLDLAELCERVCRSFSECGLGLTGCEQARCPLSLDACANEDRLGLLGCAENAAPGLLCGAGPEAFNACTADNACRAEPLSGLMAGEPTEP